ncbi:MAG: hypothetical protein LUQ25_05815 [Methanoregulaceae archaeon]|nr:hypothetical protein [Methanoregulaceae archaeon]
MTEVTDEFMKEMIGRTKEYSIVILKSGPDRHREGVEKIIWEHARRNFALREEKILAVVCPVADGSDLNGIGICNAGIERVKEIMDGDPGVKAGVFTYEVHPCRSFPGDCLPE